jgi:hypothetical protein
MFFLSTWRAKHVVSSARNKKFAPRAPPLTTINPMNRRGQKEKPDVGLEPTTLRLRVSRATDCASRAWRSNCCCCFDGGPFLMKFSYSAPTGKASASTVRDDTVWKMRRKDDKKMTCQQISGPKNHGKRKPDDPQKGTSMMLDSCFRISSSPA